MKINFIMTGTCLLLVYYGFLWRFRYLWFDIANYMPSFVEFFTSKMMDNFTIISSGRIFTSPKFDDYKIFIMIDYFFDPILIVTKHQSSSCWHWDISTSIQSFNPEIFFIQSQNELSFLIISFHAILMLLLLVFHQDRNHKMVG